MVVVEVVAGEGVVVVVDEVVEEVVDDVVVVVVDDVVEEVVDEVVEVVVVVVSAIATSHSKVSVDRSVVYEYTQEYPEVIGHP